MKNTSIIYFVRKKCYAVISLHQILFLKKKKIINVLFIFILNFFIFFFSFPKRFILISQKCTYDILASNSRNVTASMTLYLRAEEAVFFFCWGFSRFKTFSPSRKMGFISQRIHHVSEIAPGIFPHRSFLSGIFGAI